ncbi:MAG: LysR substrate-binding domain-containing protein [Pseudomonadota bacterium]
MPRQLPPLNALRAFEAAGRHGSFTGAAAELNVTHAAISRHVRGLERRLGVLLFRNAARGVELTETGADYLAEISPALDRIADATEGLSVSAGTLTISCEPTFAVKWLMPRLGQFHDSHQNIEVQLLSSAVLADLERHECDLAIRFLRERESDLPAILISASPVYPYGAPDLAFAETPADLTRHRLLHEDRGDLWRRWFADAGAPDAAPPGRKSPLPTLLAIEGALAGQGVVLASEELVANDVRAGRLKKLASHGYIWGGYFLVSLPETMRRRPARAFRDWFLTASENLRPV